MHTTHFGIFICLQYGHILKLGDPTISIRCTLQIADVFRMMVSNDPQTNTSPSLHEIKIWRLTSRATGLKTSTMVYKMEQTVLPTGPIHRIHLTFRKCRASTTLVIWHGDFQINSTSTDMLINNIFPSERGIQYPKDWNCNETSFVMY
jgi:hypothetical protein